jgi:DNA-binding PadR family transcriptional regulator
MPRRRADTLELAVLGLLADSPMHGYELRKQVNALLGWTRLLSYGTLYPCLKALGRAGFITADSDLPAFTAAGRNRRPRIVYRLTADGKERLAEMLEDAGPAAWEDDSFDVRFAFFSRTQSPTRVRILEGRRTRLEERLANVRSTAVKGRERMDAYTKELQRHGLESVEREISWLTELIERELNAGFDSDASHSPTASITSSTTNKESTTKESTT